MARRFVRARTGRKIHVAHEGSTTAFCGWWMRGAEQTVTMTPTAEKHLCEKCTRKTSVRP